MIDTILFDLDGTLLISDSDKFTAAYFAALGKYMSRLHDPEELIKAVWAGTKAMVKNDGSRSNEAAFWETYSAIFGETARDEEPLFAEFYATRYEELKVMCGSHPEAPSFITELKAAGYKLAVATNPLFPLTVQKQRIGWSGLDPEIFDRITSYENSSFSKPNPKYYLELLDRIGSAPENSLMVGNDAGEDMIAEKVGMKVFLLTDCLLNRDEKDISAYPQGNFTDLKQYAVANGFRPLAVQTGIR